MPLCPACHADLKGSPALTKGQRPVCPFCGVELHLADNDSEVHDDEAEELGQVDASAPETPLPPKSRLEVVDHSADRLVVHIPPGSDGAKGLGCMALFWNGFMCLFTPPWFFAIGQGQGPPLLFIIPFLLLFWTIGLGMAWFWVRMKHTRTYLLVEPGRVVLQTQRFGRKWLQEGQLTEHSEAHLVESYRVNDVPVHAVHVPVEGRIIRFGTSLTEPEKSWLVEAINRQLGKPETAPGVAPRFCWSCGGELPEAGPAVDGSPTISSQSCPNCGTAIRLIETTSGPPPAHPAVPRILPSDIPSDSLLRIELDNGERLRFFVPLFPPGRFRTIASVVTGMVGGVWLAVAAVQLGQEIARGPGQNPWPFWIVELVFTALFGLPAVMLAGVSLFIRRGRITTDVAPDWLRVRYHWGPLGMTKRLETGAIDAVRLRSEVDLHDGQPRRPSRPATDAGVLVATVHSGDALLPLTSFHDLDVARLVAGLVQTRLEALGVRTGE